jgi:regulator of protease activity HflC (stomatin/prohibitin superfamily)
MKADYLSYKRATSVSLLGLALQLVLGLLLLVYSFVAKPDIDPTKFTAIVWYGDLSARTGAMHILLGSIVWLLLAILFDQHRRERIEQMEMEALNASGARESSAFSGGEGGDFRVAHARLVSLHKYLVPVVSLLYGAALFGIGVWRFYETRGVLTAETYFSLRDGGVAISIALAIGFIGFVFARYVAGMAKQPVWSHLRAGAGAMVSAAVFGLLYAIVQFVDKLGPQEPARWLHAVWPVVMMVLGVEVILSLLLGMYSPRKAGEFQRPALDSKIMSFVAAPDRIAASIGDALNYQFGFDVTGNWFYQLLTRSVGVLVLVGIVVVWLLSSIGVVQPNEQGLYVKMGHKIGDTLQPGPHFKLPWPFGRIETFKTTVVRRVNLGSREPDMKGNKAILWTNDHGIGEEEYFMVRPAADDSRDAAEDAGTALKDVYLAVVEIPLYYTVEDFAKFDALGTPEQVEETLRAIGQRETISLLATMRIDDVLGNGRELIASRLKKRLSEEFARLNGGLGAGVTVVYVGVEGVHPPRDTAAAFEDVVKAEHMKAGQVQSALKDADTKVIEVAGDSLTAANIVTAIDELNALTASKAPEAKVRAKQEEVEKLVIAAGGTAASAIQTARADRWTRHMTARAQSDAFIGQIAGYRAAPDVYVTKIYFDTLREALKDSRVYIVTTDGPTHIDTNLEDINTGGNMFAQPKKPE